MSLDAESAIKPAQRRGRPMKARPKLLEAAIREFAEHGFDGTSTIAIARRARTTQPLIHHHFGSKDELFRAVLDTLFEQLRTALLGVEEKPDQPNELFYRFVQFTARRPELARIWMIESARRGARSKYIVERHIGPLTELMRPMVRAAVAKGLLPNVDEIMLLYAMQGLASYPFLVTEQVRRLSGEDAGDARFAERYADAALTLVGLRRKQVRARSYTDPGRHQPSGRISARPRRPAPT